MLSPKTLRYNSELYERIRVLGKGSFGTAVVHRRRTDCALVVLKEIDLSRFGDEHRRLAALQEARIMSELSHEHIINYFNAYTTDTKLIIEMEYARIGTLQSYLAGLDELLAEEEALNIFRQIVAGLEYLHAKQIVHLDLKMGNIFISAEGTIKLGDFGIAQFMAPNSSPAAAATPAGRTGHALDPLDQQASFAGSSGRQLGTLAYSSPERCLGLATDYQSDIWSLGCILYELITLRLLFPSESLAELVTSITQVKYEPMEQRQERISALTVQMFEQMIAKDPSERPSARELGQLVEQSLSRLEAQRLRQAALSGKRARSRRHQSRADLSTEAANLALDRRKLLTQINYPHSLVYQVRLDREHICLERVRLPQSKRIKQIVKGASHYLALTYDNIVYGWGSRSCGQLGSSNLILSSEQAGGGREAERTSRSARNSFTARDCVKSGQWRRPLTQVISLTQPPSLASSTQTLEVSGEQQTARAALDYESVLRNSAPTSRPFILSELNKRKIERVAAGNNFSVFLSKTGIVMTCGDGSAGCLGRGSLTSSLSPRMVDSLLSMDVVSVASGPEHVVAVCGNGQAFAWGNIGAGRLGLGDERALNERLMYSKVNALEGAKYVTLPQQVQFPAYGPLNGADKAASGGEISILAAFCADKSTIFIDSNYACWACGENRHNKLGLDIRRKFKRTIVVNYAWRPSRIGALAKHKILSCSIGPNHSSFLTSEGKLLVLGQDVDHAYRLKCDMMDNRESQRRILAELQEPGRRQLQNANCFKRRHRPTMGLDAIDRELLAQSLLANDQLLQFKSEQLAWKLSGSKYPKMKASRFQRQQIETYLKRSRALRRMPFDGALAVSCTSKFTLALTSDNRVYFWGTRSYRRENCCPEALKSADSHSKGAGGASLQLVSVQKDECFIKISSTNSTLMNNIESFGSDQPILHARDPRLIANSLADLWILDYRPSPSPASSSDSLSGRSSASPHPSSNSSASSWSKSCSNKMTKKRPTHDCQKHDAILEPQPIVSLYVPSMFNHNGCALRLVNLFCHDEDRFFLVLDTTITMQQPPHSTPHQSTPPSPSLASHRAANSTRDSHHSSKAPIERAQLSAQLKRKLNQPNGLDANQEAETGLDMVEELRNQSRSEEHSARCQLPRRASCNASLVSHSRVTQCAADSCARLTINEDLAAGQMSAQTTPECCRREDVNHEFCARTESPIECNTTATNSNSVNAPAIQMSPISQNGFSLEEPRSMSTFMPNLSPQQNNIILGPSMSSFAGPLRRLDFGHPKQPTEAALEALKALGRQQRRHRSMVNLSESTGVTCDEFDETTSIPTWVKNEFLEHQTPGTASKQLGQLEAHSSSTTSATVADECESESDLTTGSSSSNFRSTLSISSRRRPTDDERSSSSSSSMSATISTQYQSTLIGSRDGRLTESDRSRPMVSASSVSEDQALVSAAGALSLSCVTDSGEPQAAAGERARVHRLSTSQPDLRVGQGSREVMGQTVASTKQLICDNIINCSVYKAANKLRANDNSSIARKPNRLEAVASRRHQGQDGPLEPIKRSHSALSRLDVGQTSVGSSNSNTTRKGQQFGAFLAPPPTPPSRNKANRATKGGDQHSSSCAEMRDTSAEVTMIEMLDRRAGAQLLASRSVSNQRGLASSELPKTISRWRQALTGGLSGSQKLACADTRRSDSQPSISSLRKSLTRIFC